MDEREPGCGPVRRYYKCFLSYDGSGNTILSRVPDFAGTQAHGAPIAFWIGMPKLDTFIGFVNARIAAGFSFADALGSLEFFPFHGDDPTIANGNPDYSDYALDRAQRGISTAGKPIQHPSITFNLFLALIYRTLISERQFSQASKVLTILKMLNSQLITIEEAKIRFTNIRPAIKT